MLDVSKCFAWGLGNSIFTCPSAKGTTGWFVGELPESLFVSISSSLNEKEKSGQ